MDGEPTLLVAGETGTYDGPWVNPDDARKVNGLIRYSQGTALDGVTITGMAYSNKWSSTDQVPQRAISSGLIGLYGSENPTDGGIASRFALSARAAGGEVASMVAPTRTASVMSSRHRPTRETARDGCLDPRSVHIRTGR